MAKFMCNACGVGSECTLKSKNNFGSVPDKNVCIMDHTNKNAGWFKVKKKKSKVKTPTVYRCTNCNDTGVVLGREDHGCYIDEAIVDCYCIKQGGVNYHG